MNPVSALRATALVLLTGLLLPAADQPLGRIDSVAEGQVVVRFDADPQLAPDTVLAVFTPGALRKHPLTGEVITEEGRLIARLLTSAESGAQLPAMIVWQEEGVALTAGLDVVPQPGEASPDAPPLRYQALPTVSAAGQSQVTVTLPIFDPEEGGLRCSWRIDGPAGRAGRLSATTTTAPSVSWIAPGEAAEVALVCTARDRIGQESTFTVTARSKPVVDWRPEGKPTVHHRWGGYASVGAATRANDGTWFATTDDGIVMIDAGWRHERPFAISRDAEVRSPVAVQAVGDRLYVLDSGARAVVILDAKGQAVGRVGSFSQPSDMLVATDGSILVADQGLGGVIAFEADGRYRCRLGEPGSEPGTFRGLTSLARGVDGTLYALDTAQGQVQRWDRLQRRLKDWDLQLEERARAVDVAIFRDQVLVLLADGRILRCDERGVAKPFAAAVGESGLTEVRADAAGLICDAYGTIIVSYPRGALLARYAADGRCTGVRASTNWYASAMTVEAGGRVFAVDSEARIAEFDAEGWLTRIFGGTERNDGPFRSAPSALACTPDGSALVALDKGNYSVVRFDLRDPTYPWQRFGKRGTNNGEYKDPSAIAVDGRGRIYVADEDNHNISVLGADGTFLFRFGRYERGRDADEINRPALLAVTPDGATCYVYDSRRYEIQKFTLSGEQAVHVTNCGGRGSEPGRLGGPVGMGCDRAGLLYIADASRRVLQVVDFRGKSGVTVQEIDLREDLGLDSVIGMAVGADGMPQPYERDGILGLVW